MRLLVLSVSVLFITCLGANCAIAQNGQWGQADVFYSPKPDLGGYEVVNDPEDAVVERSQAPAVLERSRAPAGVPLTRLASSGPSAPEVAAPPGVRTENMGRGYSIP